MSRPAFANAELFPAKVGYTSIQHIKRATDITSYYSHTPSLHLKGNWLEETGFTTDTPVTVTVERGQLVIRPAE
jgi:toxic protein SymE